MTYRNTILIAVALAALWCRRGSAVDVTISSNMGEAFPINVTVTFLADATNVTSVTTYTWDFADGTPSVVTMVPNVDHVFTSADSFLNVTVTVDNGVDPPGSDFDFFEAFVPPLPTDPPGTNAGDPPEKNPDDGITYTLLQSLGGFASGVISVDAPDPSDVFTTDFGDGTTDRHGTILQHRYTDPGIFILETDRTQAGSPVGKMRKTLVFSELEVLGAPSDPLIITPAVQKRKLVFKSIKGKFFFGGGATARGSHTGTDTVAVSWIMTLPAGLDLTAATTDIAIGNVVDTIGLNPNGTGVISQPSPYKSVRFSFPRLKKGITRLPKEIQSRVTVQMAAIDLTTNSAGDYTGGFDTEGISPKAHQLTGKKGPFVRNIQVAAFLNGVSYSGNASVNLTVANDDSFGTMTTRR